MLKVLTKEGSAVRVQTIINKVVVCVVFLYESDIWVVTGVTLTVLDIIGWSDFFGKDVLACCGRQVGMATSGRSPGVGRYVAHQTIQ